MKNGMRIVLAVGLGVALLQIPVRAAEEKAAPKDQFKDQKERLSYAIGFYYGSQITNAVKRSSFDVNFDVLTGAIGDVVAGREPKMNETQAREAITAAQKEVRAKQEEERKITAEKNRKAGDAFLAANKTKAGVKTKTVTLSDGTTAEMQYKVLKEGTGATPGSNDTVQVIYRGTLIDGKEFDNSTKHGDKPARFPVRGVVPGWTHALEMMKVGSKWELYLPSSLAYGDANRPGIDPGATLIFEMELVSVEAPCRPAAHGSAVTSDIIKVPSAEELKKGAKIEVLKPEEAAKLAQSQTNNATKK